MSGVHLTCSFHPFYLAQNHFHLFTYRYSHSDNISKLHLFGTNLMANVFLAECHRQKRETNKWTEKSLAAGFIGHFPKMRINVRWSIESMFLWCLSPYVTSILSAGILQFTSTFLPSLSPADRQVCLGKDQKDNSRSLRVNYTCHLYPWCISIVPVVPSVLW